MEILREIYDEDVKDTLQEDTTWQVREAARAIVLNHAHQIAILHVTKDHYHKLPGGGVEAGEDLQLALRRELMEEVGVEAKVIDEVGIIIERRNRFKQISYCYVAEVIGECNGTSFTEKEINEGFQLKWVELDQAISLLTVDQPESYIGKFICQRDLTFLQSFSKLRK